MNRTILCSTIFLFLMLTTVRIINPANANIATYINQTYGGTNTEDALSLVQTVDGGYAITGYTGSFGVKKYHVWLVKTDELGNHQWNQTYGGTYDDNIGWAVVQTTDGGYAITGLMSVYESEDSDVWLIKTDASGNHQWNQTYGGTNRDSGRSLMQTTDGGYAILGSTKSFGAGGDDFWLIKTDASGNHQWNQTYGGTKNDYGYSLVQTTDGGYAITGYTWSFGAGQSDIWLVKTDEHGNHQWNQTYGGTDADKGRSLVQTVDGGYAIAGYTGSFGVEQYDVWLVKTDQYGVIPEFPILTPLLLVLIIFTVTITIYRRRLYKRFAHARALHKQRTHKTPIQQQ